MPPFCCLSEVCRRRRYEWRVIRKEQVNLVATSASFRTTRPCGTNYHVISHTRPSRFSACNIEKLGWAWGRGYPYHYSSYDRSSNCVRIHTRTSQVWLSSYNRSCDMLHVQLLVRVHIQPSVQSRVDPEIFFGGSTYSFVYGVRDISTLI